MYSILVYSHNAYVSYFNSLVFNRVYRITKFAYYVYYVYTVFTILLNVFLLIAFQMENKSLQLYDYYTWFLSTPKIIMKILLFQTITIKNVAPDPFKMVNIVIVIWSSEHTFLK